MTKISNLWLIFYMLIEMHVHGSLQRSGFSLYCLGKENTLKNVSGLNDCQLLQRREDKTGRTLMVLY